MFKLKEKLNKLPQSSGVYLFKNRAGDILYIGKATNLRSRVRSYFQGRDERGERILSMVRQVADIKIQQAESVLEALILESNLIKKFQPKYNIERKDDKSFSYFAITEDNFPSVLVFRKTEIDFKRMRAKNCKLENIYGPYTSKKQIEVALKIIRKIFPYHSLQQKNEKGCLDFQLGLCPGPYAGAISKKDYLKNIRSIKMILEGKKRSLITVLEKEMMKAAEKNEFEKAAEIRNKVFALKHIRDVALISENKNQGATSENLRIEAYDISNIGGQYAVGSMIVFKNGESNKKEYRKFRIKTIEGNNDVGMMAEILFRRFKNEWAKPDLILLDGGKGHLNMGKKILKEFKLKIPIIAVAKGKMRKNVNLHLLADKPMPEYYKEILNNKKLIRQIMDEAHRFAITFHKKIRRADFI